MSNEPTTAPVTVRVGSLPRAGGLLCRSVWTLSILSYVWILSIWRCSLGDVDYVMGQAIFERLCIGCLIYLGSFVFEVEAKVEVKGGGTRRHILLSALIIL